MPVNTPQGVAYAPAQNLILVASSTDGTLSAFSAAPPFALAWTLAVGLDADSVRFDSVASVAWVASGGAENGNGNLAAVSVTATAGALLQRVDVGADHPEEMSLSPISRFLTVSVPATAGGGVKVVDRVLGAVAATFPAAGSWARPFAQRVDASGSRLWVASAGDAARGVAAQLVVLNAIDGTLLFSTPTPTDSAAGAACDDIALDDDGGLAFAACGGSDSKLYVVQQAATDARGAGASWVALGAAGALPVNLTNARGLGWRAATRTLYVPVPAAPGQAARVLVFAVGGGGGGGGDDDDDDDEGVSVGVAAGGAVAGVVVGALLGALAFRWKYGARGEASGEVYGALN